VQNDERYQPFSKPDKTAVLDTAFLSEGQYQLEMAGRWTARDTSLGYGVFMTDK
jgi:hypothetical protein